MQYIRPKVQKPDNKAGEEIEVFADDKSLSEKQEPEEEEEVPDMLEPNEEEGEEEIVMTDDIPFKSKNKN